MKNKTLLAISAFITVFILTLGIGVVTTVTAKNNAANALPTVDATAFIQREKDYQQLINEANLRIEAANQQIATLSTNLSADSSEEANVVYLFSAEQALVISQQLTNATPQGEPTLVNFGGSPAYEISFINGKVYIDANTGAVLYNGLVKPLNNISSDQALVIASAYLPTSMPVSIHFDDFNGATVYEIEFADGQKVYVDMSGKVVAVRMASSSSSGSSETEDSHESENEHD